MSIHKAEGDPEYKIAFLDLENAPNTSYTWGKWEQNVIEFTEEWYLLSFAVKWTNSKRTEVYSLPDFKLYKKEPHNDKELVQKLWEVFNEADLIIAHNGDKHDIRKANARFAKWGLLPPSPYKSVDTLKVARARFAFNSNSLADLCAHLGIGTKADAGGFATWKGCMDGNPAAWKKMCYYNKIDVVILEKLYNRLRAWDRLHPNINLAKKEPNLCPACGSKNTQRRGFEYMKNYQVQRFKCNDCGRYSKGKREKKPVGTILT